MSGETKGWRAALRDRRMLAIGTIALAAVFFVAINVFIGAAPGSARIDLTEDRLFTISDGTRAVLAEIDEPIELRVYYSSSLDRMGPFYANYLRRLRDLLDAYARIANGKLVVKWFDPQPFSPEEDMAVADGIEPMVVDADGTQAYFGIAGSNSTDDVKAFPVLSPERANFLEYDLTRLIYDLAHPDKPVVAVIGDLPLQGSRFNQFRRWAVIDQMDQFFDVRFLGGDIARIDDDVKVLVLAQPRGLAEKTLYAIDQFVMRGGRVLAFVDPLPEELATGAPPDPDKTATATLAPLFKAWGVEIPAGKVVGDRGSALRVQTQNQGRTVIVNYLPWIALGPQAFAADDVITANLQRLDFRSAGEVRLRKGAKTKLEPLVTSTADAMEIDAEKLRFAPDPAGLLSDFKPSGKRYVIAARITGPVESAFPKGPPEAVKDEKIRAAYKAKADAPLQLVVVADSDFLADRSWLRTQQAFGQTFQVPVSNNADFAVNALDNLTGSAGLIAMRGRGLAVRPFTVIEDMTRAAEAKYRTKEKALLDRINETKKKIRDLQKKEKEGGVILTAEEQKTIDGFRTELIAMRRELRDVQHNLRKDVARLETRIKVLDIWAVPVAVAIIAIALALLRRVRAARFHHSAQA